VEAFNVEVERFNKEALTKYRTEMAAFMKLPGVKDLGDGRFQYPKDLTPPEAPKPPEPPQPPDGTDPDDLPTKHLKILLGDRSPAQLDSDILAALDRP
jgi:hypothetical protein